MRRSITDGGGYEGVEVHVESDQRVHEIVSAAAGADSPSDRTGEIESYDIAEGTDFFISVWNLHRNPRLWDKPEEFIPERFPVDGKAPDEYTEDFAYLPFGGGQRKCIGDQFAIFESIVTLAMIMRRFDFELDPKFHPDGECGMTTGATIHTTTGLHVKLKRRNKHGGEEMNGEYTAPDEGVAASVQILGRVGRYRRREWGSARRWE